MASFFDDTPRGILLANKLASYLVAMRLPNAAEVVADDVTSVTGFRTTAQLQPATDVSPAYMLVKYEDVGLVLIFGASSQALGVGTWGGYVSPEGDPGQALRNSFLAAAFRPILAAGNAFFTSPLKRIQCVGWSAGGVIATYMADRWSKDVPDTAVSLCTFGSPRSANRAFFEAWRVSDNVRYMIAGDPIPHVPPDVLEFPLAPVTFGTLLALQLVRFRHGPGGVVLTATPSAFQAVTDGAVGITNAINFAGWWSSQERDLSSPHSIEAYEMYTSKLIRITLARGGEAPVSNREEPADQANARQLRQVENQQAQIINESGERQNIMFPTQPPDRRFGIRRAGRVWYCQLDGTDIAISGRKSRARGLAASGNDFVRRLQRQPSVDLASLLGQLTAYLDDASSSDGGFVPPIATDLTPPAAQLGRGISLPSTG